MGVFMLLSISCASEAVQLKDYPLAEDYKLIRPEDAEPSEIQTAVELYERLSDAGIKVKLSDDFVMRGTELPESAHELLVGATNRPVSGELAEGLKCGDFVIALRNERIVIVGGSEAATEKAVDYFINNCIGDGILMLPEDILTIRGDYRYDSLKICGAEASEYRILTEGLSEADLAAVSYFQAELSRLCGYILPIAEERTSDGRYIKIGKSENSENELSVRDSVIELNCSDTEALHYALRAFVAILSDEDAPKSADIMLESQPLDCESAPLVSLNLPEEYPPMEVEVGTEGVMSAFLQARSELPDEVTVLGRMKPEDYPDSLERCVYVSPSGDDSAEGDIDSPLKSPKAALDRLVGAGGGVVYLRAGTYKLSEPLSIGEVHSGTDKSPLFISAYKDESVTITGAIDIPISDFQKETDLSALARLHENAADSILVAKLDSLGFAEEEYSSAAEKPILYIDGLLQTNARYPNEGEELLTVGEVLKIGKPYKTTSELYGLDSTDGWELRLMDSRPLNWSDENDIKYYGSLFAEWEKDSYSVTIDKEKQTVKSSGNSVWGARYDAGNRYYFYNVLEELDRPGEWYLDYKNGRIYIYPEKAAATASLVTLKQPLVKVSSAANVVFDGITFTGTMDSGITVEDGYQVIISDCEIRGCGKLGLDMVGRESGVIYSSFSYNYIGTVLSVGASREAVIEYNEFELGSTAIADSGMIYVGGPIPLSRGIHIRYNYFHDLTESKAAVYLDDCSSGHYVYGNIVDVRAKIDNGKNSYRTHNGRECVFWNNISIGATDRAFGDHANYYYGYLNWNSIHSVSLAENEAAVGDEGFTSRYPIAAAHFRRMPELGEHMKSETYESGELEDKLRSPKIISLPPLRSERKCRSGWIFRTIKWDFAKPPFEAALPRQLPCRSWRPTLSRRPITTNMSSSRNAYRLELAQCLHERHQQLGFGGRRRVRPRFPRVLRRSSAGARVNYNSIDSINLDMPWWVSGFNDQAELYGAVGDYSLTDLSNQMVLYFNKRIYEDYGYENIYDLVRSGDWTYDEFLTMLTCVGAFSVNFGIKYVDRQSNGALYISFKSEKMFSVYDMIYNLRNNMDDTFDTDYEADIVPVFMDGRSLFLCGTLGISSIMREMDDDFGIVPMPKYDEAQENYITYSLGPSMCCIPRTADDAERTGTIIDALNYYTHRDVLPAYYEIAMKSKYARDDDSAEMLDLIRENSFYDIGFIYSNNLDALASYFGNSIRSKDDASSYAGKEPAREALMQTMIEKYKARN